MTAKKVLRKIVGNPKITAPFRFLTLKNLIAFNIWSKLPVEGTFKIPLPNGNHLKYRSTDNSFLDRVYYWRGLNTYENETYGIFYNLAKNATVVLDIGANTGIYTLLACSANRNCAVIAFEPIPHVAEQLKANVSLNKFEKQCEIINKAVSDENGKSSLYYQERKEILASLSQPENCTNPLCRLEVDTIRIDSLSPDSSVDLVKIDVESCEDRVLEGMSKTINKNRPDIIAECCDDGPYRKVEQIVKSHGYSMYHLKKKGPILMDCIVPDPSRQQRSYLFTIKEPESINSLFFGMPYYEK